MLRCRRGREDVVRVVEEADDAIEALLPLGADHFADAEAKLGDGLLLARQGVQGRLERRCRCRVRVDPGASRGRKLNVDGGHGRGRCRDEGGRGWLGGDDDRGKNGGSGARDGVDGGGGRGEFRRAGGRGRLRVSRAE